MNQIPFQLGRFWWWVQQGGNSNIILVAITAWYSWLTFRLLRWSTAQAREQLRPNLVVSTTRSQQVLTEGHCSIQNMGERTVKVLDALVTCYVDGKRFSRVHPDNVQGVMLPPSQTLTSVFPISPRMDNWVICTFRVVCSDVGGQVFMKYEYWSNAHKMLVSVRRPIGVVLRLWVASIQMPLFRIGIWMRLKRRRRGRSRNNQT
jgi:hypothetical protein